MSCNKIDKYIIELDDAIVNIMNDYKYISIYIPELIKNGIISNGTLLDLDISIDNLKQKIDSIIYVCGQSHFIDTTDHTNTNTNANTNTNTNTNAPDTSYTNNDTSDDTNDDTTDDTKDDTNDDTTNTNNDIYVKIYDKLFNKQNTKDIIKLPIFFLYLMLMDNNSILNSKTFYQELDTNDKYIEKNIENKQNQQTLDIELD